MKTNGITTLIALGIVAAYTGGCSKLLGPSPKQQVIMTLDVDDADQRREGIARLSSKKWGLREPYLEYYALLLNKDADALVRCAAVSALGRAGDRKYLKNIAAVMSDKSSAVRWDAAVALDNVTGDAAVEPLRRAAIHDDSMDVRMCSARALRHYDRPEVIRTLVACLSDPAFGVRYQARASLVQITGRDMGSEPHSWAGAAEGKLPPPAPIEPKRRWWRRSRRARASEPATQPATMPATKAGRLWWDWMGVTKKREATSQPGQNIKSAD